MDSIFGSERWALSEDVLFCAMSWSCIHLNLVVKMRVVEDLRALNSPLVCQGKSAQRF